MKPKVIEWDESHLPEELRKLPPGRYAVEPIDHAVPLTPEEEAGILDGLDHTSGSLGTILGLQTVCWHASSR